ncbi:unnamed protein product, partial [Spodoptera littoralis]
MMDEKLPKSLKPLPSSPNEAQTGPTDKNAEDEVAKEDPSPSFFEDWLPPELLVREFTALPTYIDKKGIIYLYDSHIKHTRELIRKELIAISCVNYKDPDPEAMFRKWSVGQPCVVLESTYEPFRGRVLESNQKRDLFIVNIIGYEGTVALAEIRYTSGVHPEELMNTVSSTKMEIAEEGNMDENSLVKSMESLLCNPNEPQAVPADKNTEYEVAKEDPSLSFFEDWLPPELQVREFTALPTHIDNKGIIYLYDVHLKHCLAKSCVSFKDPDPEAMFRKWSVGQQCVVLHSTNQPYRGRVLEVNQESKTCVVHNIDHGYVETCSFGKLREAVPLSHIPPHSLRCSLNRIRPKGTTWDEETLNYLRKSIVEKECFVKVVGDEVDGVVPIELRYETLWVNDYLVNVQRAEYQDSWIIKKNKELIIQAGSSSKENEDSAITAKFPTYPKYYGNKFICDIVEIHDVNTLPVHLMFDDESVYTIYEDMSMKLQCEYVNMSPLDGIFENKPCIALCSADNHWYRASIQQYNKTQGLVKIRYVDHGHTDVIPVADIREISQKWLKHPPATLSVKLFGLHLNRDKEISEVVKHFSEVFIERFFLRELFIVNIIGY